MFAHAKAWLEESQLLDITYLAVQLRRIIENAHG